MTEKERKLIALIFFTRFIGSLAWLEKRCSNTRFSGKIVSLTSNEYICPREHDPLTFTECCNGGCCEKRNHLLQFDDELIMIIGVTVITICMILMAVIVICCFWSKCPCYTTCRPNYTAHETIVYTLSKDDPNLLMLNESEGNQYTPCLVKIKKVEEY